MEKAFSWFVVLVIAGFLIAGLFQLVAGDAPNIPSPTQLENGLEYKITTLEGMKCIVVQSTTYANHAVLSVSCDWSEYRK